MIAAVVGPSGAGKDTLLALALQARPDLHLARRVITRPAGAGGEDHEPATPAAFAALQAEGRFALHWQAHGLSYGIRWSETQHPAVVFNGSRAALGAARARFPDLRVIVITAPAPLLAQRLTRRGRETPEQITERLSGATAEFDAGEGAVVVVNDGTPEQGAARLLAALGM